MLNLYELIQNIEKRPAMYLGQPSISNLRAFLSGYTFARRQLGTQATLEEQKFASFQGWVQEKFKITTS